MSNLLKKAFTLIELLVVIAIIGILSGLIVVSMGGMTTKATIAKAQVFSNSLRNSLMMNIVAEWKFDELTAATEGTNILDSWGGINNGTLDTYVSTVDSTNKIKTGVDCISGGCLSLDGTDDYISINGSNATSSNLAITGAITISAWVKFNNGTTAMSIAGRGIPWVGAGDNGYFLARGGSIKALFSTSSTTTRDLIYSTSVISDNNWHNIVGTWDGTTNLNGKKIYVDGTMENQAASTISSMGRPNYLFRIGEDSNNGYSLNGLIDEVRVYSAAVSASQIKEQYYAGLNKLLAGGGIIREEYQQRIAELENKTARE